MSRRRTGIGSLKKGAPPADNSNPSCPKIIHNKIVFDDQELISYFKNHTLVDCAEHFKCSKATIKKKLKSLGVDTSIHNNSKLAHSKISKINKISLDTLRMLYIDKNMDAKSIAEDHGIHFNTVRKWIREYKLTKSREDISRSMMSRHFRVHGCAHPAQRPEVIAKTRSSAVKSKYVAKCGKAFRFRSLYELSFALYLDSKNLEWHYEEMRIPYVDNMSGKWKVYIIDFTVVDGDDVTWIEVKPNNNMIPIDKRIYAERRAESAGVQYRGLMDDERKESYELLLNGYRNEHIAFLHPKPRSNSKQVSYYFKSLEELHNFNIPDGWCKHTIDQKSDYLCVLRIRRRK